MAKGSFDVFCATCNLLVDAKVIAHGFGGYRSGAVSPLDEVDSEYHGEQYSIAVCRRCSGPFFVRESVYGIPGEFSTVTDEIVLYPPSQEARLPGLPVSVGRSLEQAHRSLATASFDACALMCRRALEAVCKELSASGSNLARKLADLHANGHIDARLLEWAHGVRLVGNDAAHEMEAGVSREDARDILDLTEALLMYAFTLDAKFRAFQVRRSQRPDKGGGGASS